MPSGRPKKTLDCLPQGWQEHCLGLASEGASDVELRHYLDISNDLWYRFMEEEPIFSETIKRCATSCQVWWEKNGRKNLDSKDFNSTLWYMNMKNRFGWKDKQEVAQDITSGGEKITEIRRTIIDPKAKGDCQES